MDAAEANRLRVQGERQALTLEPRLRGQYTRVLKRSARQTTAAYRAKSEVLVAADEPHRVQPTVDEIFNGAALAAGAIAATRVTRQRIALAAGGPLLRQTISQQAQRLFYQPFLDRQAGRQAERLVQGSRDAVVSVIGDSISEGWTVPETAAELTRVLDLDAAWRGTMLARTDLVSISNAATTEAAESLGEDGPGFKTWLSAGDDHVRPTHADADGQTVALDEAYEVGDSELMYPGDPDGPDDETINCRCTSVFTDDQPASLAHSEAGGIL